MERFLIKFFSLIVVAIITVSPLKAGDINGIRFWKDPEKTRLVFDVSEKAEYKLFTLQNPHRLVIDFKNADLKTDLNKIDVPKDLVSKIRSSEKSGELRIVMDLTHEVLTRDFTLNPYQNYGHRLVVDLREKNARKQVIKTADSVIKQKNRDIVIAIDAGHGGEDPGALGKKGTREKHVTLEVAKRLAALVNKEKGFKAFLTRSGDYYIGLEQRTKLARKNRADLLVSLHADGFTDPRVKGASVWVLSTRGANTEMGKWLEQREKSSDRLGGVESLQNKDPLVAQVLIDLSMHYSVGESIKAGEEVRKQLKSRMSKMHGKGLRKAAFMVLRMPDIPAMLVEMAFISNPTEEKLLKTSKQQNKIARAVFEGVRKYFRANPPDGTYLANLAKAKSHRVARG
ncbi:MAG: N-acetylmuramoyl-L-alanine amidase, partial [Kangiellaceae bacterium]|nr:N-acetylmuramoyl-L-alanine amidase [Kangiellaceae bacterium]